MKRILPLLFALPLLLLAFVLGGANANSVVVDLLWVQLEWPLGVLLMLAMGLGLLLMALFLYSFHILPLQYRLRACQRRLAQQDETRNVPDTPA